MLDCGPAYGGHPNVLALQARQDRLTRLLSPFPSGLAAWSPSDEEARDGFGRFAVLAQQVGQLGQVRRSLGRDLLGGSGRL